MLAICFDTAYLKSQNQTDILQFSVVCICLSFFEAFDVCGTINVLRFKGLRLS